MAYGRDGYRDMLERQVRFARAIAKFIDEHKAFELLPEQFQGSKDMDHIFIIVLFRAVDEWLNKELLQKINEVGTIYVSGTSWKGRSACRTAVSNWQVDVDRDTKVVRELLEGVASQTAPQLAK